MMASNPLLPKTDKDFAKAEFWDKFIKARGGRNFEWYGEYTNLCGILHKYVRAKDRALVLGCGNSTLSQDLFDTGHCRQVTSIDNSSVAIRQMRQRHGRQRPELKFLEMDATNMTDFADASFTCAIDKAVLDAIYSHEEQREAARKMLLETGRVLSVGGRYVIISLAQEHIVALLSEVFGGADAAWLVRVHLVPPSSDSGEFQLPVFAFIFTKCVPNPRLPKIVEVENPGADKLSRLPSFATLVTWIASLQEAGILCASIKPDHEDRVVFMNEFHQTSFVAFIINLKGPCERPFSVFLVPFGKHSAPAFATAANRLELARTVKAARLLLVFLNPRLYFESATVIQTSLSSVVMRYAPRRVESPLQEADILFLSCGEVYPSRAIRVKANEKGEEEEKEEAKNGATTRVIVEEISEWGRRAIPISRCPFAGPIAGTPTCRAEEHAKVWMEFAAGKHNARPQVFTGGAQPIFPGNACGRRIDLTCFLGPWGSVEDKEMLSETLREFVLPESFQTMKTVHSLDAAPAGEFHIVVWNESNVPAEMTDTAEVASLKRLLAPQGLLILVTSREARDSVPVLEYEVPEPILGDRHRLRLWSDDPASLFSAMIARSKLKDMEGLGEADNDIVTEICEKLEAAGRP